MRAFFHSRLHLFALRWECDVRIVSLLLAWSSPLLLVSLRSLFTEWVRLLLSGLLLSGRILFLLLPTRLLSLVCFVCHGKTPELNFYERT